MHVWVDTRERNFIDVLRRHVDANMCSIDSKQLDCGDILIEKEGEMVFLVERKTIPDLEQSISDGRYHEQKLRMLQNVERHRLVYLIEGNDARSSRVAAAIFNTHYLDDIKVEFSENAEGSCAFLAAMVSRIAAMASPVRIPRPHDDDQYFKSINARKQKNVTPEMCYLLQLSQLPQVSISIAKSIAEVHPDMVSLVNGLITYSTSKERIKALSKIPRVGAKLASTICTYMYPHM
jgi:ERCC4-type nuclease